MSAQKTWEEIEKELELEPLALQGLYCLTCLGFDDEVGKVYERHESDRAFGSPK